ncbi:hypothetical protein Scep_026013 [Stephania cephalantha]|uniref:Uncharacterized protein n=1 Tax=Stephania cephalantha TaxID=152367 RepID=A0AAP0HPX3_9MAGN
MARGKSAILRQEVDGEPTRARRRTEVATTSTSPSAPVDRGKRKAQTASYRKEKQRANQILGVRARPYSGDEVEAEASNVPVGSRNIPFVNGLGRSEYLVLHTSRHSRTVFVKAQGGPENEQASPSRALGTPKAVGAF